MKVLLSAFMCDPKLGSEPGNGWNWATGLAKLGFEVHCLTWIDGKQHIEAAEKPANLTFHFIKLPGAFDRMFYFSQPSMYVHYLSWQGLALQKAKALHKELRFDVAHHVTWGSLQLGSFLYKLDIPFVFGPAGGGQQSPVAFKKYFGTSWAAEQKREKVSSLLVKYNPAFRGMISKASAIWVSNPDSLKLVKDRGASQVHYTLDAALPQGFFPKEFQPKTKQAGKLKLLWVGRFMPRKGMLFLLEVMEVLKNYPGITLTVVGDGEQRALIEKFVTEKRLEDIIFLEGSVPFERVKYFYASHDAFIFTSLRDSCPAQLIEAMAYGMPVITLNLHGQAIIVSDETGFRCSCETPETAKLLLVEAALKLYREPELFHKMSQAAHHFASKQTWDHKIRTIVSTSYPIPVPAAPALVAKPV